ncbi:MAG: hypothetical protein KDE28_29530 [Anaerolineales bacterium]|nr:hypothetical protein [Anaerolineales bacterium]MCB2017909.1 DUF4440 domain-containing protein [Hydrogenophaga sp.]
MEPQLDMDPALQGHLDELKVLENLFHAAHADASPEAFDRLVPQEFWETGATGRRYSRAFARQVLAERGQRPSAEHWISDEYHLQAAAPGVYLLTYRLMQPGRVTRRLTVWRKESERWLALYHQGTVVAI